MMIDVIVPHYGPDEDLEKCLRSFEDDSCVAEIVVLDNNKNNIGFTRAVNNGIRQCYHKQDVPYVAVVNNDTTMLEGGFTPLAERMSKTSRCGLVTPCTVHSENHDRIVHAGGEQMFPNGIHRSGLRSLQQWNEPCKLKWSSFVVVLIRKSAILEVGLLDERMFLICSDSDFCVRLRYAGWECWYEPGSVWTHKIGESGAPTSEESRMIQRLDTFRAYEKYVKPGGIFQQLDKEVV